MAEYLTNMNAKHLLTALEDARHITPRDRGELEAAIQKRQDEPELPLYLRVLAGVGAFIASLCILAFLGISHLINFDKGSELLVWGVLFIITGVGLAQAAAHRAGIALHSFLMQWSFCCVGVGKIMATGGAVELLGSHHGDDPVWIATFSLGLITAATWPFYRMSIDRFLSSTIVLFMLLIAVIGDHRVEEARTFLLNGLLAFELCVAALLFTSGWITRTLAPLGYALVASIISIVFTLSAHINDLGLYTHHAKPDASLASVMLSCTLMLLTGWAAGGMHRLKQEHFMIACLGAALLGFMGAPGVILAVILMVLGYARHDRYLISAGAALAPAFLWLYYYNLDLTLIAKSAVLVGSGAVLLAGRAYMHARKLDKEA